VSKVLGASWQRCRVHFKRNVLVHAGKQGPRVDTAFIGTASAQDDARAAAGASAAEAEVPACGAAAGEAERLACGAAAGDDLSRRPEGS
jgi:hypothetical protein